VLVVGRVAGILYSLPVGVATILAFDWYFLPPLRQFDGDTLLVLALFLSMSVLVGALATHSARRLVASEIARALLADEQAGLRRVATLVARGTEPAEVLDTVADEIRRVLNVDGAGVVRYEVDGAVTIMAAAGVVTWPVGSNWALDRDSVFARAFRKSGASAPIILGGRLWGAVVVVSVSGSLPPGVDERIAHFGELIVTAIVNAETHEELKASRGRVVAAGDETRRRLERDLHDGIQQRLVTLAVRAAAASALTCDMPEQVRDELSQLREGLVAVLDELRETARGIHPAILTEAGLGLALRGLARRCAVPVQLEADLVGRLEEPVEVAAYYVVSEALTNAVKHAQASVIDIRVERREDAVHLCVHDDGVGGADNTRGSGLVGLKDRVEALSGQLLVRSPPGEGTTVVAWFPTKA
jgi:signal transduction histidine kinase